MNKLQKMQLDMAKYFVEFCQKNNIKVFLCGGGLIGALRHKGFIPWDDDLDFFINRDDYNKLLKLWDNQKHPRYKLSVTNSNYLDRNLFATIRDNQTTCIKPYQQDLELVHGIALDIIPLDYRPQNKWKIKLQKIYALFYSLYMSGQIPQKHGKFKKIIASILLLLIPSNRLRYQIAKFFEQRMINIGLNDKYYRCENTTGPFYLQKNYPLDTFDEQVYLDFEDTKLPTTTKYHQYLTIAFGDYMTLPPLEKRKAHHDYLILDLEKSYKEYR